MTLRPTLALAALLMAVSIAPALAEDGKTLGSFGAWQAYAYSDAGGKACYAAARADKTQGGDAKRQGVVLAITHRAKSPNEVSLMAPVALKKDSEAEIQIGGMKHTFFTRGDSAWAKDPAADKAIIAAMVKGKDVIVRATPAKGTAITDSVSLNGFSAALAAIDKACGVKR